MNNMFKLIYSHYWCRDEKITTDRVYEAMKYYVTIPYFDSEKLFAAFLKKYTISPKE